MSQIRTIVVVLERGAKWPDCLAACRRDVPDTVVIAQDEHEHPIMLARRVEARLTRLAAEGRPIAAAVLAVGAAAWPGRDREVLAEGRARVGRALLRRLHQAAGERGTLWLTAPDDLASGSRHELLALAGSLTSLLGASPVTIAVRFDASVSEARRDAGSGLYALPIELAG